MMFIDIVLLVILGAFVFFGLFFGLVHTLGALVGTVIGILFTTRLLDPAFEAFGFLLGGGAVAKVVLFILIFLIITRLVGAVFWLLGKMLKPISWIPLTKSLDHLIGGVFGFLEGVVVIGVILFYALQVLPNDTVRDQLEQSSVADYLTSTVTVMEYLFPDELREAVEQAADTTAEYIPEIDLEGMEETSASAETEAEVETEE